MVEHAEMYVKGKRNKKLPLIYVGVFALALVLSFVASYVFGFFGLFLGILIFAAGAYAAFRIGQYYRVEYEYAVLGGTFCITVIRSQSLRKTLIECDIKEIDGFSACEGENPAVVAPRGDMVYLDCTGESFGSHARQGNGEPAKKQYYFTVRGSDGKAYKVRIEPDEKILEALRERNFEVRRFFMKNGDR